MYMRYAGGGVGHYKVDLKEGSRDSSPPPEPEPAVSTASEDAFDTSNTARNHGDADFQIVNDAVTLTNLLGTVTADADGHDFAENDSGGDSENDSGEDSDHEDLESESESSENDDEEGIEENFGAEDGEGMFGDIEDEEGYAPLWPEMAVITTI